MAKRRASNADSDDEESVVETSPASKRARVDADASDAERDDDTAVNEDGETEADKKFEEKFADRIRASMESRQGVQGVSCDSCYASFDWD